MKPLERLTSLLCFEGSDLVAGASYPCPLNWPSLRELHVGGIFWRLYYFVSCSNIVVGVETEFFIVDLASIRHLYYFFDEVTSNSYDIVCFVKYDCSSI